LPGDFSETHTHNGVRVRASHTVESVDEKHLCTQKFQCMKLARGRRSLWQTLARPISGCACVRVKLLVMTRSTSSHAATRICSALSLITLLIPAAVLRHSRLEAGASRSAHTPLALFSFLLTPLSSCHDEGRGHNRRAEQTSIRMCMHA